MKKYFACAVGLILFVTYMNAQYDITLTYPGLPDHKWPGSQLSVAVKNKLAFVETRADCQWCTGYIFFTIVNEFGRVETCKRLGNPSHNEFARAIISTPDGGYIIVGSQSSGEDELPSASLLLVKLSATGTVQWSNSYGLGHGRFHGTAGITINRTNETDVENYIVGGHISTPEFHRPLVLKVSGDGALLWINSYDELASKFFDVHITSAVNRVSSGSIVFTAEKRDDRSDIYILEVSQADGKPLGNLHTIHVGGSAFTNWFPAIAYDEKNDEFFISSETAYAPPLEVPRPRLNIIRTDGKFRPFQANVYKTGLKPLRNGRIFLTEIDGKKYLDLGVTQYYTDDMNFFESRHLRIQSDGIPVFLKGYRRPRPVTIPVTAWLNYDPGSKNFFLISYMQNVGAIPAFVGVVMTDISGTLLGCSQDFPISFDRVTWEKDEHLIYMFSHEGSEPYKLPSSDWKPEISACRILPPPPPPSANARSLETNEANVGFKIYPTLITPSQANVFVEFAPKLGRVIRLTVTDVSGRIVTSKEIGCHNQRSLTFNVGTGRTGTYLIKVVDNFGEQFLQKLVVQ